MPSIPAPPSLPQLAPAVDGRAPCWQRGCTQPAPGKPQQALASPGKPQSGGGRVGRGGPRGSPGTCSGCGCKSGCSAPWRALRPAAAPLGHGMVMGEMGHGGSLPPISGAPAAPPPTLGSCGPDNRRRQLPARAWRSWGWRLGSSGVMPRYPECLVTFLGFYFYAVCSQAVCMPSLGLWARRGSREVSSCTSRGPATQDLPFFAMESKRIHPVHPKPRFLEVCSSFPMAVLEPSDSVRSLAARGMPVEAQGPPSLAQLSTSEAAYGSAFPLQLHAEAVLPSPAPRRGCFLSSLIFFFLLISLGWYPWYSPQCGCGGEHGFSRPSCRSVAPCVALALCHCPGGPRLGGLVAAGARRLFKTGPAPSPPSTRRVPFFGWGTQFFGNSDLCRHHRRGPVPPAWPPPSAGCIPPVHHRPQRLLPLSLFPSLAQTGK